MKNTVDKLVDHLEWLRGELEGERADRRIALQKRQYVNKVREAANPPLWGDKTPSTVEGNQHMVDVINRSVDYRTALENIATSAADKETLKTVAREVLSRWREKVGE